MTHGLPRDPQSLEKCFNIRFSIPYGRMGKICRDTWEEGGERGGGRMVAAGKEAHPAVPNKAMITETVQALL